MSRKLLMGHYVIDLENVGLPIFATILRLLMFLLYPTGRFRLFTYSFKELIDYKEVEEDKQIELSFRNLSLDKSQEKQATRRRRHLP